MRQLMPHFRAWTCIVDIGGARADNEESSIDPINMREKKEKMAERISEGVELRSNNKYKELIL